MKCCEKDTSETIGARALKLGELIVDDEYTTWLIFGKKKSD